MLAADIFNVTPTNRNTSMCCGILAAVPKTIFNVFFLVLSIFVSVVNSVQEKRLGHELVTKKTLMPEHSL